MIRIISVGAIKEEYIAQAIAGEAGRIRQREKLELLTAEDEKCPEELSDKEKEIVKRREGQRLLRLLRPEERVIALTLEGKAFQPEEFATMLRDGPICFLIGGSLGLAAEVRRRADRELSFGPMTYPHQLMRWILLEQIAQALRLPKRSAQPKELRKDAQE